MPRAGRFPTRVSAPAVADAVQLPVRSAAPKSPAASRSAVTRGADVASDSIRLAPATVPPSRAAGRALSSRHASLLTTPAAAPSGSKGVQTVEIRPAGTVVSRRAATNRPAIRHLPLAAELARAARQGLVSALDGHKRRHGELFEGVVGLISREVVPLLRSSALAGFAEYTTQDKLLESPLAQQMLIDVLTDRGFGVAHAEIEKVVRCWGV